MVQSSYILDVVGTFWICSSTNMPRSAAAVDHCCQCWARHAPLSLTLFDCVTCAIYSRSLTITVRDKLRRHYEHRRRHYEHRRRRSAAIMNIGSTKLSGRHLHRWSFQPQVGWESIMGPSALTFYRRLNCGHVRRASQHTVQRNHGMDADTPEFRSAPSVNNVSTRISRPPHSAMERLARRRSGL